MRRKRRIEMVKIAFLWIFFSVGLLGSIYCLCNNCEAYKWTDKANEENALVEINDTLETCQENGSAPFILVKLNQHKNIYIRCIYNEGFTLDDYISACSTGTELKFYVLKSDYDQTIGNDDVLFMLRAVGIEAGDNIIASKEEMIKAYKHDSISVIIALLILSSLAIINMVFLFKSTRYHIKRWRRYDGFWD